MHDNFDTTGLENVGRDIWSLYKGGQWAGGLRSEAADNRTLIRFDTTMQSIYSSLAPLIAGCPLGRGDAIKQRGRGSTRKYMAVKER